SPIPIDISKENLAISIEKASSPTFDAVIAAHLFGIAAPIYKIKNKKLIEDCAQCIGIKYQNKIIGSSGRFSISSFYGTKIVCAGHGGVICGNRDYDYEKAIKILKHDKIEKWQPHLHFLLSDLNASLGISQFTKLDFFLRRRREIASTYYEALGYNTALPSNNIFFRFLIIPNGTSQKELIAKFANAGIEACKPVYKPIFKLMNMPGENFPNSDWADRNLISIPIYPALKRNEVQKISHFLRKHKNEISCWPPA
ncbi:MAG TPA: DegT/DnrJ/EryC1/StrS family aminotransferase, partial [Victivallales bacterium]|nr:DegT/DnrJ/EryC1/StrS family aminotransferase [Victivallales bacterium]